MSSGTEPHRSHTALPSILAAISYGANETHRSAATAPTRRRPGATRRQGCGRRRQRPRVDGAHARRTPPASIAFCSLRALITTSRRRRARAARPCRSACRCRSRAARRGRASLAAGDAAGQMLAPPASVERLDELAPFVETRFEVEGRGWDEPAIDIVDRPACLFQHLAEGGHATPGPSSPGCPRGSWGWTAAVSS